MRLENKDTNVFLILWIKSHPEFWRELRDIQIKLLIDRIIQEKSFEELALEYEADQYVIKRIFNAILLRIEKFLSKDLASHLRYINTKLDADPGIPLELTRIYLN